MKNIGIRVFGIVSILSLFIFGVFAKPPAINKDKMKAEELITKHLESIGSAEARKGLQSIMAIGTSNAVFKGRGTGIASGRVVLTSQAEKNMIGMRFNNADYQFERMGYDGKSFTVGYRTPGVRSLLGSFLLVNKKTFKRGLMGGILSTSWELYNYDRKRGKLKYSGKKKIGKIKLIWFGYSSKGGSDLRVSMFFDPVTFRHVRTEYKRVITSKLGTGVDNSAQQSESRYKMVEEFGDFRTKNGLTLPHKYNLYLEILTGNGSTSYNWKMTLQNFIFNQNYAQSDFRVDGAK